MPDASVLPQEVIDVLTNTNADTATSLDTVVSADNVQVDAESRRIYHFNPIKEYMSSIDEDIKVQLSSMQNNANTDSDNIQKLAELNDELKNKMAQAFVVWQQDPSDRTNVQIYIKSEVIPLLEDMLVIDNSILDTTTADMDTMYTTVLESIQQTIFLSFILMLSIFLTMFVYISLLYRREEYEEELSRHLKDALAVAQNANMAKTSFLSSMSHEIRTPLNAIIGLTVLGEDNIEDPVYMRQCLGQITTSSNHLLQLINDILDMNRIESGKTTIARETFSLPELMTELSTINKPQTTAKGITDEYILKDIQHEYVVGDPTRIRQILLNLTNNAIKYTNTGDKVIVSIQEIKSSRPEYANLIMTVEDTGIGMQKEFMQHIFEPFERERNAATNFNEGTGLGMAITKNLVTMMDGTISVESELGVGTKFTVAISLQVPTKIPELNTEHLKGVPILVTDDSQDALLAIGNMLEGFGMKVKTLQLDPADILSFKEQLDRDVKGVSLVMADVNDAKVGQKTRILGALQDAVLGNGLPLVLAAENWRSIDSDIAKGGIVSFIDKPIFRSRLHDTLVNTLDLAQTSKNEDEAAPKKQTSDEPLTGRVLIVEDNDLNMEIATELVKKFGPEVSQAADGVEGVQMVKDAPDGYYDLIFMDWQMPRMNGIEATKALVEFFDETNRKPVPIVAMTANAFTDNRREALASGMDGFMAKPINLAELKGHLYKYLKQ